MRGEGPTTMMRVYKSDRGRMAQFIRAKNSAQFAGARMYTPDAVRAMIDSNLRMKKRVRYLELEVARMDREIKELRRTVNSLK
jgi:hypothetical protein